MEYEIKDTLITNITIGTSDTKNINITHYLFTLTWADSAIDNNYDAIVKFTSADFNHTYTDHKDQDKSAETLSNGFAAFKDAIFSIRVDAAGKVTLIDGYDDFKHRLDSLYAIFKKGVDLNLIFPKEFLANLFERATANLPDTGASTGATWTRQISSSGSMGQVATKIQSQIIEIKGDIAYIATTTTNNWTSKEQHPTKHSEVKGKGVIRLDATSGLLLFSRNSSISPKTLLTGGLNDTMQTTHTTEMTGKPL